MTIPVAIVGCGLIGRKRAESLGRDARVVAVHDVDEGRAERLAHDLGPGIRVVRSVVEAATAARGGLTVVATVHDSLVAVASVAARAGSHLLVEKPGARNASEARELREVTTAAGVQCRVGFNHRFHPSFLELRRLLIDAQFGDPIVIRARYGHGGRRGYETEWRADKARSGGGELLDQGVHLLDLCRFLAGPISLRYASLPTRYWDMAVEDNAFIHAELANGGDAWLHASWTEWKNLFSFEIACRTAKLEVTGLGGSYGPERLAIYEMPGGLGPPKITTTEWPPGDTSWSAEMEDVLAAVSAGGGGLGATLDDCIATLELVDEAYQR